jgi:RNA polymerase sigma-70 factor (ECF subfamily)
LDASNDDLVRRSQRGDAGAFGELVRRYERTVLSVAYGALGCPEAAGDAAQEAFVRAWQRLATLKEPKGFGPWLVGIVRNLSIDQRRKIGRSRTGELGELDLPSAQSGPAAEMGDRELRQQIDMALADLDDISRCAVVLRYYDGHSSREIADLLDLSPGAVDMRLSRARQELKRILSKQLQEGESRKQAVLE